MEKLTGEQLKDRLLDHPNVYDYSIQVHEDQVTFKLIDSSIPFPFKYKGCEVIENDCEGYEDEFSLLL